MAIVPSRTDCALFRSIFLYRAPILEPYRQAFGSSFSLAPPTIKKSEVPAGIHSWHPYMATTAAVALRAPYTVTTLIFEFFPLRLVSLL